ncbi:ABC transporter permease [Niallia sp. HCP3S3_B10]|uniref:ABC transporter permease n=1 Tax=Bacillaceae TaxID=186817 RepID=UPI002477A821|nr:ABC transporter permease [Bacillus sp. T2.9-1]CAI9393366.1 hypothetical protein BACSP_03517 [Bacillus sp. T2.9-1]
MFEFNEKQLWKDRAGQTAKEYGQYLKYIFNGHLVIVLVFLLGTAAFYYQAWLKTIPDDFPVALIMSIILTFFLTNSPTYTFLKDADRIFLIAVEMKMKKYFLKSMVVSFVIQGYLLLILLAALMPLYAQVHGGDFSRFWYLLIVLLITKGANLLIRWHVQYYVNVHYHYTDTVVRFFVNLAILYLLFADASPYFILVLLLIMAFLLVYFQKETSKKGLNWEYLIEQDEKRLASFYRFANMFTEVPKLRNRIKRRRLLDLLFSRIPYAKDKVFAHLYWRTYIRAGDYFGLTLRLTVISGIFIFFLSFGPGQVFISVLFVFLTGLQLLPLWNAYDNKLWITIYPVESFYREKAFKQIMATILGWQGFVLTLIIALKGDFLYAVISLIVNGAFIAFFVLMYINKKVKHS